MTLRVRFAPSPTGYLHVGGARTALFNWLLARKLGGAFLLRIEDTDRQRSSDEHTQVILDGLTWLGLDWDEEIVFQGAGLARHQALANELVASGQAYEDDGAIRFRMPDGEIAWDDVVYGRIGFQGTDLDDWVILRSDRTPTYNFVVVADDIEMHITHVIRGEDHVSNTPKQIALYEALGHPPPAFAHLPMLYGADGKKLSKRHGATAVGDYRKEGILPGAMRNFLALLGWNPGDERELFCDIDELVAAFSLERVQHTKAIFDTTKLEWMNGQYLSRMEPADLRPLVEPLLGEAGLDAAAIGRDRLLRLLAVVRERARTTRDLVWMIGVRVDRARVVRDDPKVAKYIAKDPAAYAAALTSVAERLHAVDDAHWTADVLDDRLRAHAEARGVGLGAVMQPIRIALTGTTVSEGVHVLLELVGKEESLARIEDASKQ
ncbi:MAG TPA: glutamate--tRNA ligase [Gemmatimonadales bacterium]